MKVLTKKDWVMVIFWVTLPSKILFAKQNLSLLLNEVNLGGQLKALSEAGKKKIRPPEDENRHRVSCNLFLVL